MHFYDEVVISVQSGKGGDGLATGRREAGVAFGGPSGGDGGKGGSVVLRASKDQNTLLAYKYRKNFKAKPGDPGQSKDKYGANAQNIILDVPIGTLVKNNQSGKILHIFSQDKEEFVVVKGGEGGYGNIHFKDAVHQFPNFALLGEPGHSLEILLELQLLADVALIGTPSVGKSTLINAISHTKAKTAEYSFTTLVPNLGSVDWKGNTFNVIDIPGLIKGSAQGKGLGNAFLRHVLKARVFAVIVDIGRYDQGIPEAADLLYEIFTYVAQKFDIPEKKGNTISIKKDGKYLLFLAKRKGEIILEKRMMFVINKYDLVNDKEILDEYKQGLYQNIIKFLSSKKSLGKAIEGLLDQNTVTISAMSRFGVDVFLDKMIEMFHGLKMEEVYPIDHVLKDQLPVQNDPAAFDLILNITDTEKPILLERGYLDAMTLEYKKIWAIKNFEICKLVWMLPWGNQEAEHRFWKVMDQNGFLQILEESGVQKGDILKIISYYQGKDDRYVMY